MDELHEQTVNLLSFQQLPKKIFDVQVAFNMVARYGEQSARMLFAQGVRGSAWEIAARPLWRFLRGYVLRLGFLDGAAGATMAWARAYEAFRRYARLWELSRLS